MKRILIIIVIAVAVAEVIEHVVLPLVWVMMKKKRRPSASQLMIGTVAEVSTWEGTRGTVSVRGELWTARAERSLAPGSKVVIRDVDGLTLTVAPASEAESGAGQPDAPRNS